MVAQTGDLAERTRDRADVLEQRLRSWQVRILHVLYIHVELNSCTCIYMYMLMRDVEGRKKQARSYKQQSNTTHVIYIAV